MKIVFDTNVLIAAFITVQSVSGAVVNHCAQAHTLITSDFILDELREKLIIKFRRHEADVEEALTLLRDQSTVIKSAPLNQPVCRDPDDDQVLATALTGSADCIITGDKDLLTLNGFQGIAILKPSQFAEYEKQRE
jgi:putative PIN family toxin of toxin-antitoxin system